MIFTAITSIIQKIGKNNGWLTSFLNLLIPATSCYGLHYMPLGQFLSDLSHFLTIP